jgi:hypothetical protein
LSRGLTTTGPITTLTVVKEGAHFVTRLNGNIVSHVGEEIILSQLKSRGLHPPQIIHFANVQIARDSSLNPLKACMIDLGHVRACNDLPGHLGIFVQDEPLNWGITTKKSSREWPSRMESQCVNCAVFGPQLVFEQRRDNELREWLQPTDSYNKISSGVVCEAIRLSMLVDKGRCSPEQMVNEVERFVDLALAPRRE